MPKRTSKQSVKKYLTQATAKRDEDLKESEEPDLIHARSEDQENLKQIPIR